MDGHGNSLRTLVKIAKHPRLSQRLTHLRMDTHYLAASVYVDSEWTYFSRKQVEYIGAEKGIKFLVSAMSKLPALRSIEVGELCKPPKRLQLGYGAKEINGILHRHADGQTKPLDSHNCERCLEHLTNQLDLDPDLEDEFEEWWTSNGLTSNFADVLYSIAATGKQLESLSACLWAHNVLSWRLQGIELAAMPPIARLRPGLLTAFSSLRTLHLAVSCRLNEEISMYYHRISNTVIWTVLKIG